MVVWGPSLVSKQLRSLYLSVYLSISVCIWVYTYLYIHTPTIYLGSPYKAPDQQPGSLHDHMYHYRPNSFVSTCRRHAKGNQSRMSGQYYWLTKRTWILYKESNMGLNMVSIWNPMSILNMSLLYIVILTVANINRRTIHPGSRA